MTSKDPNSTQRPLVEGIDYNIDPDTGYMVLTAAWLRRRGYCCGKGCRNCPYSPEEQKKAGRPASS